MSTLAVIRIFKIIAILFSFITIICGECSFRLPEDPLLRPKIFQTIGLQTIDLIVSENINHVELYEKQKIQLVCDTEFESPRYVDKRKIITVECNGNNLVYEIDYYHNEAFQCSPLKWNLYESTRNFVWCPNNVTSYLLARPTITHSSEDYEYLAGVCYDTYSNSLKTLYYRMTPEHDDNFHPTALKKFYSPLNEIEHHRNIFRKRSVNEKDYDNVVFSDWIKYSQYNLSSILQIPRINKRFYAGSFLDIIWWPSLRLGNWKRYEMALEKHIENANQSYDILAGVSDVVKAPVIKNCNTDFTLKTLSDNVNRKIPFYIWNYLRATDNSSEVVIIGVNSPFYEFYSEKDVVFCKDICQEIPWLKAKSSTFHFSALGIIFCCNVNEVKSLKRLDGFPTINIDSMSQRQVFTPAHITPRP